MPRIRTVLLVAIILLFQPRFIAPSSEAYFSPDDHPTNRLIELINNAKKRIHAAVYMLTDTEIATALIRAQNRGVDVQLILDQSSVASDYGKGKLLKQHNIEIFVFSPRSKKKRKSSYYSALMHNKFAIIDNRLWTGSFNWTKSANNKNQENVIILDDATLCAKFLDHFQIMKKRCTHYSKAVCPAPEPTWSDYFKNIKQSIWAWLDDIGKAIMTA